VTTDAIELALARIERKLDRLLDPDGAALALLSRSCGRGPQSVAKWGWETITAASRSSQALRLEATLAIFGSPFYQT
jgi:hypothetical protein